MCLQITRSLQAQGCAQGTGHKDVPFPAGSCLSPPPQPPKEGTTIAGRNQEMLFFVAHTAGSFSCFPLLSWCKWRQDKGLKSSWNKKEPFPHSKGCQPLKCVEVSLSTVGYWGHGGFGQRLGLKILMSFPTLMVPWLTEMSCQGPRTWHRLGLLAKKLYPKFNGISDGDAAAHQIFN